MVSRSSNLCSFLSTCKKCRLSKAADMAIFHIGRLTNNQTPVQFWLGMTTEAEGNFRWGGPNKNHDYH